MRLLDKSSAWLAVCLLVFCPVAARGQDDIRILDQPLARTEAAPAPIVYWQEARTQPRPLRIHVLQVNLAAPGIEAVALTGQDPDGPGGAESRLERPLAMAARYGVMAAVNANAFDLFPPPPPGEKRHWRNHAPAEILGWARRAGRDVSLPQSVNVSLWIDPHRRGHIGNVSQPQEAMEAVAGFGAVLREGEIAEYAREPFHPRTAAGLDRDGRTLWLVVVDGRQTGYSEGMALGELAELMQKLGCWNAVNLDGGGSSIMLLATKPGRLQIRNRPSEFGTRPIPVMLGVKRHRSR